jgi:NADH dehydrogenase
MMSTENPTHKILIVGGGFGGAKLARTLGNMRMKNLQITLLDPKSSMEYHAAFYRMVTGRSPMEACLPYAEILRGLPVDVICGKAQRILLDRKEVVGSDGSTYHYDTLVLSVGAEAAFFGVSGAENSYVLRTANDALKLKRHIHELFEGAKELPDSERAARMRLVIVGGGATGVELAAELALYLRTLSAKHGVDPSFVTIDLVEAKPRLLDGLPIEMSNRVQDRLCTLGVNVFCNRIVQREDDACLHLKDMDIRTKTVVWTAGMRGHRLLSTIKGIITNKKGQIVVNSDLTPTEYPDVFVLGDAAATKYSGMAQTALYDAQFCAQTIIARLTKTPLPVYSCPSPVYAVPVGPKWAAVAIGSKVFYGRTGWMLRRLLDLKVFLMLLSPMRAVRAFFSGTETIESCEACA